MKCLTSTDTRAHIDRYERTHRSIRMLTSVEVRQLRLIFSELDSQAPIIGNKKPLATRQRQCCERLLKIMWRLKPLY